MSNKDTLLAVITAGQVFIEEMKKLNLKNEDIEVVGDTVNLYENL